MSNPINKINPPSNPEDFNLLKEFVLIQQSRTFKAGTEALATINSAFDASRPFLKKKDQLPKDIYISHKYPTLLSLYHTLDHAYLMGHLAMKSIVNMSKLSFITSDNPIASYNTWMEQQNYYAGATALAAKGLQIFLPIAPRLVTYISIENEFVSSISGMHGMRPSKEEIMTVEATVMIALSNNIIMALFEKHFDFNYIFRVMVQKYYMDAQERAYTIRVGNVRERYLYFKQTAPGFIDRIPLEYVASLLDVKPATLARIKKQHSRLLNKEENMQMVCKQLEQYLTEHTPYKTKDLKLSDLAQAINITSHELSSLLNNHYRLNFVDFINTYRINSIKEQIMQPENMQSFTIEALACQSGFSSRSAFYKVFKKLTGASPVEFVRGLQQ